MEAFNPADSQLRISTAAIGDTVLVAAVADKRTKVHALRLSSAGIVTVQIRAGSTVLEVFNFGGAGTMAPLLLRHAPYYTTGVNEALNINLSGLTQVDGRLEYTVA